jgi:pimeloyl-ACP methyl ester carboxylesterase
MKYPHPTRPKLGLLLTVDGRRVHALVDPAARRNRAPVVVLLHGCGSLAEEIEHPFAGVNMPAIALDRPGYGFSDPLPAGQRGPAGQADWLERVLSNLGIERCVLVAHSLAAGPALLLAERAPRLVEGLLLVSPFCRPTPHRAMPLLRLAMLPLLGPLLRHHVLARLAGLLGRRCLRECFRPNPVPDTLSLPFAHAAQATAIRTMGDELFAFNTDMLRFRRLPPSVRLQVLHGAADATADPDWHLRWLQARAPQSRIRVAPETGHMPHHVRPEVACAMLQDLLVQAGGPRAVLQQPVPRVPA